MKIKNIKRHHEKDGVALIIVLGLLSILTLLAVAFAIAMRVERLAARNYADLVRSKHLIRVAMIRAIGDINSQVSGNVYPNWKAISSIGTVPTMNLVSEEATNVIPQAQWNAALAEQPKWMDITNGANQINGRVGYIALNTSGLLDANYVGGPDVYVDMNTGFVPFRSNSTSVTELDLSGLSEINSGALGIQNAVDGQFFYNRPKKHRRYETIAELEALNPNFFTGSVSNFFVYSYDLDRDRYFVNTAELGTRNADLPKKFNINSITNFPAWTSDPTLLTRYTADPAFMNNYFNPLVSIITAAQQPYVHKPADIAWNIVNWLDLDRIPQTGDVEPWNHTEGGEALPLLNEVILTGVPGAYKFTVEVWFPFAGGPNIVCNADEFNIDIITSALGTQNETIPFMKYGTASEFVTFDTPFFPSLPVTIHIYIKYGTVKVDHGPLRDTDVMDTDTAGHFAVVKAISVDDPRSNGKNAYWSVQPATPGAMNANCNPWMTGPNGQRQGLPIYAKDGLMEKVGELGYMFLANRENQIPNPGLEKHFWSTISLYESDEGSYLLDHITTRDPNAPPEMRGLISINSQQPEVLRTLFKGLKIGPTDDEYTVTDAAIDDLVAEIISQSQASPFISFQSLFTDEWHGGAVGQKFRAVADAVVTGSPNDKHYEDVLRNITEMITFRQNIFTILLGAQTLASDGTTVLAEKRAVATVYRDSYTGQTMTRSFKWLTDK